MVLYASCPFCVMTTRELFDVLLLTNIANTLMVVEVQILQSPPFHLHQNITLQLDVVTREDVRLVDVTPLKTQIRCFGSTIQMYPWLPHHFYHITCQLQHTGEAVELPNLMAYFDDGRTRFITTDGMTHTGAIPPFVVH